MTHPLDLKDKKFGKLFVVERRENNKFGKVTWMCQCDCGNSKTVIGSKLITGETKSCGCLRVEVPAIVNRTHGKSSSRIYRIWHMMRRRCTDTKNPAYERYGASGIKVCDEWLNSFEIFYADMGDPPTSKHSLDRKDNSNGYNPQNCRWATPKEQSENSSRPQMITFNGETRNVTEWARFLGISQGTLSERLEKWSLNDALGTRKTHKSKTGNFQLSQN